MGLCFFLSQVYPAGTCSAVVGQRDRWQEGPLCAFMWWGGVWNAITNDAVPDPVD